MSSNLERHLRLGVLLPHLEVFGGVRRYLMLSRTWNSWGHEFIAFTPEGRAPEWLPSAGGVLPFSELAAQPRFDALFTPQPALLPLLRQAPTDRRVFYCVLEGEKGFVDDPALTLMANSSALRASLARRTRRPVLDGVGGIDPAMFRPVPEARVPRRVLAYGRRSRPKKGTDLVVRAVERIAARFPGLELVLFDHVGKGNERDPREGFRSRLPVTWVLNPSQEDLAALYASADVFCAAEKKAGWCNTAIEAMSAGAAVVCTPSGTRDFARHGETAWVVGIRHPWLLARGLARVLADDALRARLQAAGPDAVKPFAWPTVAAKILRQLGLEEGVPNSFRNELKST